jgi:hypothetical protein
MSASKSNAGVAASNGTAAASSSASATAAQIAAAVKEMQERKNQLDREVGALENQIFNLEGSYLEDTWAAGNAVRGFEQFSHSGRVAPKGATNAAFYSMNGGARKQKFKDTERIFSHSSATAERSVGERFWIYTEKDVPPERFIHLPDEVTTVVERGVEQTSDGGSSVTRAPYVASSAVSIDEDDGPESRSGRVLGRKRPRS